MLTHLPFIIQGSRKEMDLEDLYHVNFEECYGPQISGDIKDTGFDTELMNQAENHSSKWEELFKYSSPDEDVQNISRIIKTTGFNADQVNLVNQHRPSSTFKQESIAEKNNLIFLDKKFFKFELDEHGEANEHIDALPEEEAINSSKFSTVFDEAESSSIPKVNELTKSFQTLAESHSEKKKNKRKKRNKKSLINEDIGPTSNTDIQTNLHGAPPGAKGTNSRNMQQTLDLTKNSNNSLQFRL